MNAVTAVLAGFALALAVAGTGHAEPSPAELEAQIDSQWQKLEPTIEQHNKLRAELQANQTKSNQLATQLKPLEDRLNVAFSQVSGLSTRYYKGGNTSAVNAILTTGSPLMLADQLSLLDHIARKELFQVRDVLTLKRKYDAEKKPLDEVLAQQKKQEAELAEREKVINVEIKRLNDLRIKAYGNNGASKPYKTAACPYEYTPDAGGRAAKVACAQIGKPYVWAAAGPDTFDCSGLMVYAWANANAGVKLRHHTTWQFDDTARVTKDQLKAGDLVFYYSDNHHVGMYVGGGWVVHAPTSGDVVRMKRFDADPIYGYGRPRATRA